LHHHFKTIKNMDAQETTFNNLPEIVGRLVCKIDKIETLLLSFRDEIRNNGGLNHDHVPMSLQEAADFLRIKTSTMYYYVENNMIPATRKGKGYIFFKDELIKWQESGRNTARVHTVEEVQAEVLANIKRKPKRRRELPD